MQDRTAHLLPLGDGISEGELRENLEAAVAHGAVPTAYDIECSRYTWQVLNKSMGRKQRGIEVAIEQLFTELNVPQYAREEFRGRLELLDALKRDGLVGRIYPIGVNSHEEPSGSTVYSFTKTMLIAMQDKFAGAVLSFADFERLSNMAQIMLEGMQSPVSYRSHTINSNISGMLEVERSADYVIMIWPLYIMPAVQELERRGIATDNLIPADRGELSWRASILADALNSVSSTAGSNQGTPTSKTSIPVVRYTLLKALGYMDSWKEYFYSLRWKGVESISATDRSAISGAGSHEEADFYYVTRQVSQWKEFEEHLPQIKSLIRPEEYRRMEKIAHRLK